jgi:bifunctional non-homologous end joining protein LigD
MLRPMLALLADAPLRDPNLVYEPKYDGIRAIAEVGGRVSAGSETRPPVHLWSRLGNEKTAQFPEIVDVLRQWARRLKAPLILDGEIVALDAKGEPTGFQKLQGRIHLGRTERGRESLSTQADSRPPSVRFIVFDVLRVGAADLRDGPLDERRAELERLFADKARPRSPLLRISEQVRGNGEALFARALAGGWEGLIAKHVNSRYKSGKRTPDWRKLKIVQEQEFVIGGWTEPRQTRSYFGALLLGVYENGALVYTGHTGTGFDEHELARVMTLLKPLEIKASPFHERPKTNERPHWVEPRLVAQIKFTEWTADGKLRHPVYLGLRDDKKPKDVHRESAGAVRGSTFTVQPSRTPKPEPRTPELVDQLNAIEQSRRDGSIGLPDDVRLSVSNLQKIFWPTQKLTKGDLLRYYVQAAPYILPAIEDRPLVMKRLPNGIAGKAFYQQRAPDDVPAGVRVEKVSIDREVPGRLVGGSLATLLYMTQLAAISQDPWFSRVQSPEYADHAAIDLDPMPDVPFARVLDVARWVRDELDAIGVSGVAKTSGADGLHIYIPLPPETPYEAGLLFCQIVATVVSHKHPKIATVERSVRARGRTVYIDYLQNIPGKTLATAYSARGSDYAGVSTPVTWQEIDKGFAREDFTIQTLPRRLKEVGDLWKRLRTAKGVDLSRVERYITRAGGA